MGWIQNRNISIAIFAITIGILLFGNSLGIKLTSTTIADTGIPWTYLIVALQAYLLVVLWKEYVGRDKWYYQRKTLIAISVVSAVMLFNLLAPTVAITSTVVVGLKWSCILAFGQIYFIFLLLTRNI